MDIQIVKMNRRREIISALRGDDPERKKRVLCLISDKPQEWLMRVLIELLGDASWEVRYYAVDAVITIGAKAIPFLAAASEDRKSWPRRMNAVRALGEIGNRAAVLIVTKRLSDPNSTVRYYAAKALGFLGDERALSPLFEALCDPEGYVRWRVIWAIGQIDNEGKSDVGRLIARLRDGYSRVRLETVKTLSRWKTDPRVTVALKGVRKDPDHRVRSTVKTALSR